METTTQKKFSGILFSLVAVLLFSQAKGSSVTATVVGNLPGFINESSGLDFNGGASFWTLEDSGDPKLYRVSKSDASLIQTLTVNNASLHNWEDLAHDSARQYMFIGDFGNNSHSRTNLKVYRIPYPSNSATSVSAEEIRFTYPDQSRFPSSWLNFDCEAFVHYREKLYLFTKPDGNAVGYTKLYRLSAAPGDRVATLVDSFYTNDRPTSAAISPDGSTVILTTPSKIHMFRGWTNNNFFNGTYTKVSISGSWTQKEAVSFTASGREIYMTDEGSGGGRLYYIDLRSYIPPPPPPVVTTGIEDNIMESVVSVFPNPANDYVNVLVKDAIGKFSFSLFDMTGKLVYEAIIENSLTSFLIPVSDLRAGVYFYKVFSDAKAIQTSRLIVSH